MQITPLLPSLPRWPRMVAPDGVPSMGQSDGGSRNVTALGDTEYLFIAIALRSTLARNGST